MSGDEELRALERAAQSGSEEDVERYICARARRAPGLVEKLVRRVIRLERVVTRARANEEQYYAPVSAEDFLGFLDTEVPERENFPGELVIKGQDPVDEGDLAGGNVRLIGGLAGSPNLEMPAQVPMTVEQLHAVVLDLTARVAAIEEAQV